MYKQSNNRKFDK